MSYPHQQVTSLRKAGNLAEAMRVGMDALVHSPGDIRVKNAVSWVHYNYIKLLSQDASRRLKNNQPVEEVLSEIREHLRGYARLKPTFPDMCFSHMVRVVAEVAPQLDVFVPFLAWAGLRSFQTEDYIPYQSEKGTSPSLVTKVARAAIAWAHAWPQKLPEFSDFLLQYIHHALTNHLEESDNLIWIRYDLSSLYLLLDRVDDAAVEMRNVLKRKSREYWAWQQMARIEEKRNPALAIACYSKALSCSVPAKFTCKLHLRFGNLLKQQGEEAAAITEYLEAAKIYQSEGWKFPEMLESALQAPWFDPEKENDDQLEFYVSHAQAASKALYSDVSELEATFLESKTLKNGKVMGLISIREDGNVPIQQLIRMPESVGEPLVPGDSLSVTVAKDEARIDILNVTIRHASSSWDCLQECHGVVDSLSKDGGRGGVYLGKDKHAVLMTQVSIEERKVNIGDVVKLWVCANPTKESRLEAFRVSLEGDISFISEAKTKEGVLRVHEKGFAFIDDIFVPPPVVKRSLDGCSVSALCVWEFNKSKRSYGWKAVKISLISNQDQGQNS